MKKIIFLLFIMTVIISCEKGDVNSIEQETNIESTVESKTNRFSFKDWNEFNDLYTKFSKLSMEELEINSFFSFDRDLEVSPAIQGILNDDSEFELGGKIIWFTNGKFYELDEGEITVQKSSIENLKEVGSVSYTRINPKGETTNNVSDIGAVKRVVVDNQYEFRKQRYVENCGSGNTQGPSPRAFKYVHEVYAEHLNTGGPFEVHSYRIFLRVKLEYNRKRRKWRLSGERREISINLTNNSFLRNHNGPVSSHPSDVNNRSVVFSSACATHQTILLNSVTAPGEIAGAHWDINVNGTITEKMYGDVERNRWRDRINW
ncbi:hypothetical protein ATO12_05930 [Aquimarina atlantica]|uniref:Lipoprotein n=1 Tax=Aquimarina atlantica TaxID=1317122 RepID=A0A023BNR8_9FLAO|nr:hypothetical protein [Aquimarina atlantica]EZH71702.1 hypothetical protein ATO12_05930 [Aquimarina atlantica]